MLSGLLEVVVVGRIIKLRKFLCGHQTFLQASQVSSYSVVEWDRGGEGGIEVDKGRQKMGGGGEG